MRNVKNGNSSSKAKDVPFKIHKIERAAKILTYALGGVALIIAIVSYVVFPLPTVRYGRGGGWIGVVFFGSYIILFALTMCVLRILDKILYRRQKNKV